MRITGNPFIDIVLWGDSDTPSLEFVEIESHEGKSIKLGEMLKRDDGYWVIRFSREDAARYLGGNT